MRSNSVSNIVEKTQYERLYAKLGYTFQDVSQLNEALTHRSKHSTNNEQLEFLDDSVLGFVISSELYRRFPRAKEGQLSRGRAALVKGETLADIARDIELGEHIRLGPGELKSGGFRRSSILADTVEAVIGAIYLDGGLEPTRATILHLFEQKLQSFSLDELHKDPKTRLQEFLQSRKLDLPVYSVVSTSGTDHNQIFLVACHVSGLPEPTLGKGSSRRKAEQIAAKKALNLLLGK